jgi:hypothetical protein
LDALRAGDGVIWFASRPGDVLPGLIEVEAARVLGAGRYDRTPERVNERNGSRRVS